MDQWINTKNERMTYEELTDFISDHCVNSIYPLDDKLYFNGSKVKKWEVLSSDRKDRIVVYVEGFSSIVSAREYLLELDDELEPILLIVLLDDRNRVMK